MSFDLLSFMEVYQKEQVREYPNKVGKNPVVSVLVVTYNQVNYIRQCLDGILMQEVDFEYEILLGDDESKDGTREICITYADKHPQRIRLFLHSRRNNIKIGGRPTGRFNFIYNILHSRGQYMAYCEGDDYWTDPNKLRKQVDFLEANREYNTCFHRTNLVNITGEYLRVSHTQEEPIDIALGDFLGRNPVGANTQSVVFRRADLLDNGRLPGYFSHVLVGDYFIWLELLQKGKARLLPDVMGAYRKGEGAWAGQSKGAQLLGLYRILSEADTYIFQGSSNELRMAKEKAFNNCRDNVELQKSQVEGLKNSFTFKLGRVFYAPFLWLKTLLGLKH